MTITQQQKDASLKGHISFCGSFFTLKDPLLNSKEQTQMMAADIFAATKYRFTLVSHMIT